MANQSDPAVQSDEARWRASVARTLKGASPDTLTSHSADGIPIGPLYAKATGAPGPWREDARPVGILPRVDAPDPQAANRQARDDVANGAIGLTLVLSGARTARGGGLAVATAADLAIVLDGLSLETLVLRFELGQAAQAETLAAFAAQAGLAPGALHIDVGLDPIDERSTAAAKALRDRGFGTPVFRADGRPHHEAGASEAQELAAVLGAGVAALRASETDGLEAARNGVSFALAADADQILTIAKFRALRRLWGRIEQACGLTPRPIRLHGETAWRMTARRDPHTNLLRTTIACAAAILGGADSVTVLPFTGALGPPDGLARRLAHNTPLVLLEEAHLGRLADPAAGSGAFETLTNALCQEAWRLFQELEREGGLAAALRSGRWQAAIATVRDRRQADHAAGRAPIVGVTAFVQPGEAAWPEEPAERLALDLPSLRVAAPFETTAPA